MVTDFERGMELGERVARLVRERNDAIDKLKEQTGAHERCKEALREANETISALQESLARHEEALREAEAPRKIVSDATSRKGFDYLVQAYEDAHPVSHRPVYYNAAWHHPDESRPAGSNALLCAMDYLYPNGAPE